MYCHAQPSGPENCIPYCGFALYMVDLQLHLLSFLCRHRKGSWRPVPCWLTWYVSVVPCLHSYRENCHPWTALLFQPQPSFQTYSYHILPSQIRALSISHSNLEEPGRQIPDPRQDPNRSIIAAMGSCGPHGSETPQALHIQCSPVSSSPSKVGGPSYQSHTTLPPLTVLIHTWLPLPSPPTPVGRAPSSCQSSRIASVGIIVGGGWWSDALSPKK